MDYVSCEEARPMSGLRLVLAAGSSGPWGEAAKCVLYARNVRYVAVRQTPLTDNDDLFAWTGTRNAPVAMYNDDKPRITWLDILFLAERIGSGPSLLPDTREGRAECIGVSHEICGEGGLGWNRRLNIFTLLLGEANGDMSATILPPRAFKDYGATPDALEAAAGRVIEILAMLHRRLERQKAGGSAYLVGDRLTAADVYFAAFMGMLDPLPHELNPMPEETRRFYASGEPELRAAITPELLTHRDFIYRKHLRLPLDF